MIRDPELTRLEAALLAARSVAEAAAERANQTGTPADFQAAMDAAAEVDRIWQQYGRRWRLLNQADTPPFA